MNIRFYICPSNSILFKSNLNKNNMKNKIASALIIGGLTLVSCTSDDNPLPPQNKIEIPADYTFTRNGTSTINYEGQTTRLQMVKEILTSFNDVENSTEESLSNMFSNLNNPFSTADLNGSGKSVKSKVAASKEYFFSNSVESNAIKNEFETYISGQVNEVYTNKDVLAAPGTAGQIADGSSARYINEKGLEYNQAFAKGLIGGLLADQILNNYLSTDVLDEGDNVILNNEETVEEGKNFTTMEHKWDEAYGYLYGDPTIPTANPNAVLGQSEDKLLFNYLGEVDKDSDFAGIAEEIFEAFKIGRAAIAAEDYELRDEQIAIIKENISKVIGIRAVYYMQKGKTGFENENFGNAFHQLSEGFGFITSLRFTQDPQTGSPYLTPDQINILKNQLLAGNGFWDVTPETLDDISQTIAAAFGFTVEQAAP